MPSRIAALAIDASPKLVAPLVGLMMLAMVGLAPSAGASCAFPVGGLRQSLAEADIVFVGTVQRVSHRDRVAQVAVESVWRGDVPPETQVVGGETSPNVVSSVDREYVAGRRYLFLPTHRTRRGFQDNICTQTRPWKPRLERFRPEGAAPVIATAPATETTDAPQAAPATPDMRSSSAIWWWLGGLSTLAVVAILVLVAVVRRRSRGRGMRT